MAALGAANFRNLGNHFLPASILKQYEGDGQLHPIEIKKPATPEKKMNSNFSVIEKSPLQRGTGAVLCLSQKLGAFDKENLIVPISLI